MKLKSESKIKLKHRVISKVARHLEAAAPVRFSPWFLGMNTRMLQGYKGRCWSMGLPSVILMPMGALLEIRRLFLEIFPLQVQTDCEWGLVLEDGMLAKQHTHGSHLSRLAELMPCARAMPWMRIQCLLPIPCVRNSHSLSSHASPLTDQDANPPAPRGLSLTSHFSHAAPSSHLMEMAQCHPWPRLLLNRATSKWKAWYHIASSPNHLSSFSELPSKVPAHFINIAALLTPPAAPSSRRTSSLKEIPLISPSHFFFPSVLNLTSAIWQRQIVFFLLLLLFPSLCCVLNLLVRMEKAGIHAGAGGGDALPGSKASSHSHVFEREQ